MKEQEIYYDPECKMCAWYTGAMVNRGILQEKGRKAYQELSEKDDLWIDRNRARNEIALVDTHSGRVNYGVDSFLHLFASRWPRLQRVFQSQTLKSLAQPLYKFISYNRKVISPPEVFEEEGSCTPDFNISMRVAYILITWVITSVILTMYSHLLFPIVPGSGFGREFLICGGQILFQASILKGIGSKRIIHYLGNMMTISALGAIGFLPLLALSTVFEISPLIALMVFAMTVFVMFLEHLRRVKYLQLPWFITLTWILYRVLVLLFIL